MSRSKMTRRGGLLRTLQRALGAVGGAWWRGEGVLREIGVLPRPRTPLEPLEDVVQETLRPVEPSEAFRQSLRSALAFAAHQRGAGLIIARPRPFRGGLILGVVCGSIAIVGTALLIVLWPRQRAASTRP